MDNNQVMNLYSDYSDEELIRIYNQIIADRNRLEWAYYYICMEMENRKTYSNNNPNKVANTTGGFRGASQFQKTVDEVIKKELKNEE